MLILLRANSFCCRPLHNKYKDRFGKNQNLISYFFGFIVACYATLQPALSVRPSVCPSIHPLVRPTVCHTLLFFRFSRSFSWGELEVVSLVTATFYLFVWLCIHILNELSQQKLMHYKKEKSQRLSLIPNLPHLTAFYRVHDARVKNGELKS